MLRKKSLVSMLLALGLISACTPVDESGKGVNMLQIGQAEYASHGDKSFAVAVAAVSGDLIIDAYIDEYQYLADTNISVPNEEILKEFWNEGVVLGSKRVNAVAYSTNMSEHGGSTVAIDDNFNKIEDYVRNQTISELEELVKKDSEEILDAVSGATLVDISGYIKAIIQAAKQAQNNLAYEYDGDVQKLNLQQAESAAEDTTCFTLATVLVDDEKIVLAYLDEFEYMTSDQITPVPNSETMNDNLKDNGISLGSKRVNSKFYSANMTEYGGATHTIVENYDAIQKYVSGKTVLEITELSEKETDKILDTISSATLTGISDCLKAIVKAVEDSK